MNPNILPPAMGKQQDRLGSSALGRQLVQEKENSEFKPVKLRLKKLTEGLVNMISVYEYHHHHHVVPPARISLTLSRNFSLSFIASGYIPYPPIAAVCMFELVVLLLLGYGRTSFMSSFLLLQQCPAYLVRLTWIVFVMGGRWPYSWCLVGCCRQDLFNIAHSILV